MFFGQKTNLRLKSLHLCCIRIRVNNPLYVISDPNTAYNCKVYLRPQQCRPQRRTSHHTGTGSSWAWHSLRTAWQRAAACVDVWPTYGIFVVVATLDLNPHGSALWDPDPQEGCGSRGIQRAKIDENLPK